ncbi:hypothetical protein [Lactobacillus intestinalis]|uniref:hypothetical protein n=1 Tax=Lactobacillus intestinalis TaxID=151781 RepID=UPI002639ED8E|nr:hypothetical protein [Lactobacillus intestinalis]
MAKYTEAKAKANKKWNQSNKERVQYINKRSATKSFILNLATEEDLKNIETYIIERKKELGISEEKI